MSEFEGINQILSVVLALGSLSVIITASSVYYMRRSSEKVAEETKNQVAELKSLIHLNGKESRDGQTNLMKHIDEKIDKMDLKMSSSAKEIKDYVSKEVTSLKAKDFDQDQKIEAAREKIYALSDNMHEFKLEVQKNFVMKSGE